MYQKQVATSLCYLHRMQNSGYVGKIFAQTEKTETQKLMKSYLKKALKWTAGGIILILLYSIYWGLNHTIADSTTDAWRHEEWNEHFMRSLSKQQCMAKTIASFKDGCESQSCLNNVAGLTGDCITYAGGSQSTFCEGYERDYIDKYCKINSLTPHQCAVIQTIKSAVCERTTNESFTPLQSANYPEFGKKAGQAIIIAASLDYFAQKCQANTIPVYTNQLDTVLKERTGNSAKSLAEIAAVWSGTTNEKVQSQAQLEIDAMISELGGCETERMRDGITQLNKAQGELIEYLKSAP